MRRRLPKLYVARIYGTTETNTTQQVRPMSLGQSNKWLDAQTDGTAALQTLPSCLSLCDLKNDNYFRLIAGEIPIDFVSKPKLKIYKGTTLTSEQGLPGIPSGIECLYIDDQEPKIPVIAVSIGPSVLFYRNLKPYYKYTLPGLEIDPIEYEVWRKLPVERPDNVQYLIDQLRTIELSQLSHISQKLLFISDEERQEYIKENADATLQRLSIVTAMTTLRKTVNELKSVSYLVIASESGEIYIIDCQTVQVMHTAKSCNFKCTPCMISATGQFDIDFRIVVLTREGYICILRKSWLEGKQIVHLDEPATGIALLPIDQTIVVVCMNNSLVCFSKKGKKLWTSTLPYSAMCMVPVSLPHLGVTLVCVALKGGLVQLYSQKTLVDQFTTPETVSAMVFGRLGQEDHVLVLITIDGSLILKILKRTADFSISSSHSADTELRDSVAESSGNLQIPKKTKVFVEQTVRERDNAQGIHHTFQTELWRLRLTAARATVDVINSAESTISGDIGYAPVKLAAEVLGIGPIFRLVLTIENMAARKEAAGLSIILHGDNRHYIFERPYTKLPSLVPGAPIKLDFKITVVMDPNDNMPPSDLTLENAIIRVMIIKRGQAKPIIAATVAMPTPEPLLGETY